jgi:hypothetical protein
MIAKGGQRMVRMAMAIGVLAAVIATSAEAQPVRDAVYRGTLVCDKLPFTKAKMREAIDVTISRGTVRYKHVVRLRETAEAAAEQGTGKLDGQNISLEGSWDGGARQYRASYSGTFVRRSARLRGTQIWTDGGRTITRACSGAIKRPFRVFLPRDRGRPPSQ